MWFHVYITFVFFLFNLFQEKGCYDIIGIINIARSACQWRVVIANTCQSACMAYINTHVMDNVTCPFTSPMRASVIIISLTRTAGISKTLKRVGRGQTGLL